MSSLSDQPLVTVYIPTFNRLDLLKRAVESVRQQTYQNLEIIIVDDCSTDGTQDYLAQLANEDQRVRYFLKDKNSGACVSRNIAIENATGEFITGLDDDDYFLKDRLNNFIKNKHFLDNYKFIASRYFYNIENKIKKSKLESLKPEIIQAKDLLSINYVNNQIFTKTEVLRNHKFNINLPAWQDLYTWYSILKNSDKAIIIRDYSYVMDMSHSHERISNKKIEKIKEALDILCEDFDLDYSKKKILASQLINYNYSEKKIYNIIMAFINSVNIYSFVVMVFRLLK